MPRTDAQRFCEYDSFCLGLQWYHKGRGGKDGRIALNGGYQGCGGFVAAEANAEWDVILKPSCTPVDVIVAETKITTVGVQTLVNESSILPVGSGNGTDVVVTLLPRIASAAEQAREAEQPQPEAPAEAYSLRGGGGGNGADILVALPPSFASAAEQTSESEQSQPEAPPEASSLRGTSSLQAAGGSAPDTGVPVPRPARAGRGFLDVSARSLPDDQNYSDSPAYAWEL